MDKNTLPPSPYQRILFCTDFSANADFAFDYALDAVRRRPHSQFHLLHVLPESAAQFWKTYVYEVDDVDNKAKHDIDVKVEQAYFSRLPEGISLQVHYRVGKEHTEILAFADELDIDLIVLGRQGHSFLEHALFGAVAEKVVSRATCAVLVVPLSLKDRAEQR